jgi:type IV secretory pathway TraG/TraD family ATPase VirD4
VYCFVRGRLAEMCGGAESTITPEDTFRGKIIILSVPIKQFHLTGQLIQVLFLRLWQQAVERRDLKVFPRALGLVCDEAQHFVSPRSFALFQATARSMRVSSCLATQSLGALETQLSKTDAQSLIANFNLKCFCSSDDSATNIWASSMIGESWVLGSNASVSLGGQGTASGGVSESRRYVVEPSEFVRLRKGGEENNFLVEGIAFRSGRPFEATGTNHIRVRFPQRIVPQRT